MGEITRVERNNKGVREIIRLWGKYQVCEGNNKGVTDIIRV